MCLVIVAGFALNLKLSRTTDKINVLFSYVATSIVAYLSRMTQHQLQTQINMIINLDLEKVDSVIPREKLQILELQKIRLSSALKKKNISMVCLISMPLFPLIYALSAFKVIDQYITYASFMIIGMITKTVIIALLTNGNITLIEDLDYINATNYLKEKSVEINELVAFSENKFYKTKFGKSIESFDTIIIAEVRQD